MSQATKMPVAVSVGKNTQVSQKTLTPEEWKAKYDSLTADAREKFTEIRAFFVDTQADIIRRQHDLGAKVLELKNHPERYGASIVEQMAELLDLDSSSLYNAKAFAETYTKEEVDQLVEANAKSETGVINWSHLICLSRVKDGKERKRLQMEVVENHMSVRDLKTQIQSSDTHEPSQRGVRPITRPRNFDGFLSQFEAVGGKFLRCYNDIWFGAKDNMIEAAEELEATTVSEKTLDRLQAAIDDAKSISLAMDNFVREGQRIQNKLEKKTTRVAIIEHSELTRHVHEPAGI